MAVLRISCVREAASQMEAFASMVRSKLESKELKDTEINALENTNGKDTFRLVGPKQRQTVFAVPGNKDGAAKCREKSFWRRLEQ